MHPRKRSLTEADREFLAYVKRRIKKWGTITQMSKVIGLDKSGLSQLLSGVRRMDFFDFVHIAIALGVEPWKLLREYPFKGSPKPEIEILATECNRSLSDEELRQLMARLGQFSEERNKPKSE